jgi:hypothetical protein
MSHTVSDLAEMLPVHTQGRYRMSKAGLRAVQRMNKVMGQQPAVARSAVDFMSGRSPTVKRRKHIIEGHPLYGESSTSTASSMSKPLEAAAAHHLMVVTPEPCILGSHCGFCIMVFN